MKINSEEIYVGEIVGDVNTNLMIEKISNQKLIAIKYC